MAILKNELKKNFTQIPNDIILSDISNEAFRLLIYLYSKSDNYKIYQNHIAKEFHVTRQTINKWFRELKNKNYIRITQQTRNGKFDYVYELFFESNIQSEQQTLEPVDEKNIHQEVEEIFDTYTALQDEKSQAYLKQNKQQLIKRIIFNLDHSVKSVKRYVTTCIDNEIRKYYMIEELHHYEKSNTQQKEERTFTEEEKALAKGLWDA